MKIANLEKETIILFNEQEQTARVETFDTRLLTQLEKATVCEDVICETTRKGYGVYIIPKTMIKISVPRRLIDDYRAKLSECMRTMNANKSILR